jgi:hypothetical protein
MHLGGKIDPEMIEEKLSQKTGGPGHLRLHIASFRRDSRTGEILRVDMFETGKGLLWDFRIKRLYYTLRHPFFQEI